MSRTKKAAMPPGKLNSSGKSSVQTWGPFCGILATVMGICLHIQWPELLQEKHTETQVNLSTSPYVFDFQAAFATRDESMQKYDFKYNDAGIDRRSGLKLEEFWDVYDGKWPVLITDIIPKWEACNWTKEFFVNHYGEERVVMKAVHGKLNQASSLALPLKLFLQHIEESSPTTWTYLEDELFIPLRPQLYKQVQTSTYTTENFFNLFPQEIRPWDCMLLWGTAYSRSSLHIDPYNWTGTNAVIKGKKRWKLFPPGQDHLLSVKSNKMCGFPLECRKYNSPIDTFDSEDYNKYPLYKRAHYIEFDQNPGEFLVIPAGWFHQAYNVEETIAVSGQFMNRNNYLVILEEILKADNLKRSRLPAHFHTLLPPDQVKVFMSLLPQKLLAHGKEVTSKIIKQVENVNKKE
ncbi:uncharacterized protein [Haliotis cracherodii]|uniref:uncharacterized protein n=1 Tax=Haliotis cracherodii TaxID=6455 RepID=UPI0039EC0A19